jgi:pimeloyl-ACP methyl ester carboxylesterase
MTVLDVPGAHLYYETHGHGPLLIMVPGASGVADSFRPVATHLAADYTVVLFDRRGFSRSRLDGPQDYAHRLQTEAEDVRELIENAGDAPATVFGASSGGIVVLELLIRHPEVVRTVVPFEPPVVLQLPDGQKWVDFFHEIFDLYREAGIGPAMQKFRERAFPETDRRAMAQAPKNEANAVYWFEHELRQYPAVQLDLDVLAGHAERILPAVGRDASGFPAHEAALVLARKLRRDVIDLPGGHVGCIAHPAEFAQELVEALNRQN